MTCSTNREIKAQLNRVEEILDEALSSFNHAAIAFDREILLPDDTSLNIVLEKINSEVIGAREYIFALNKIRSEINFKSATKR